MPPKTNEHTATEFASSELKTRAVEDLSNHLEDFLSCYDQLDHNQLDLLGQMYTNDVLFIDPFHQIQGIESLNEYFSKLYQNIDSLQFNFTERFFSDNQASVYWEMRFKHRRINRGNEVRFQGNSRLTFEASGKVSHHQDYFDSAAMLYRNLPVLKQLISLIDGRLA